MKKNVRYQNDGRKPEFSLSTFSKEFLNEIWLKLGDCEYDCITEIKILGANHIFHNPMLIQRKNGTADLIFFFHKKKRNGYLGRVGKRNVGYHEPSYSLKCLRKCLMAKLTTHEKKKREGQYCPSSLFFVSCSRQEMITSKF